MAKSNIWERRSDLGSITLSDCVVEQRATGAGQILPELLLVMSEA